MSIIWPSWIHHSGSNSFEDKECPFSHSITQSNLPLVFHTLIGYKSTKYIMGWSYIPVPLFSLKVNLLCRLTNFISRKSDVLQCISILFLMQFWSLDNEKEWLEAKISMSSISLIPNMYLGTKMSFDNCEMSRVLKKSMSSLYPSFHKEINQWSDTLSGPQS